MGTTVPDRGAAGRRLGKLARKLRRGVRSAGVAIDNVARPGRSSHGLVILDDAFPHPLSAFRLAEFNRYLETWSDAVVYSTGRAMVGFGETRRFSAVHRSYAEHHPRLAGRVRRYHKRRRLHGKLAYTVFILNADSFLGYLERCGLPFVFTLYPGGAFRLRDERSDRMLDRVCSSSAFRGVVCTQPITRDYLLERGFCGPDRIEYVYGGVFPSDHLTLDAPPRRRYGADKATLDVCFVAMKYTEAGRDKGYDTFVEVAKRLARAHADVAFHVVGPFDETDLDVGDLDGRLTFHGSRTTDFFPGFYARMDVILSPNVPFVLAPGAFDGFPTGCCIEAGLCGTAVVCTDVLELNESFVDGEELVLVPPEPAAIAARIEELRADPETLARLGDAGQRAFRRVFDIESQLAPRLRLLECHLGG